MNSGNLPVRSTTFTIRDQRLEIFCFSWVGLTCCSSILWMSLIASSLAVNVTPNSLAGKVNVPLICIAFSRRSREGCSFVIVSFRVVQTVLGVSSDTAFRLVVGLFYESGLAFVLIPAKSRNVDLSLSTLELVQNCLLTCPRSDLLRDIAICSLSMALKLNCCHVVALPMFRSVCFDTWSASIILARRTWNLTSGFFVSSTSTHQDRTYTKARCLALFRSTTQAT